jgi:hypothetical protein
MTTYSTVLKLELPGDGQQVGTWGQTTNKNFGTLVEQAITGVRTITMVDADYTLTSLNGTTDEARNAAIIATGTNLTVRKVVIPLNNKLYTISNQTTGGYAIQVGAATGNYVTIPNGTTTLIYCDGTNTVVGINGIAGAFNVSGALTVSGNATVTGNTSLTGTLGVGGAASFTNTVGFSVTPTAPTQAPGTNNTTLATTAFTTAAITAGLGTLGTMSLQNANAVAITGGTMTGMTTVAGGAHSGTTASYSGNIASLGSVSGASGIFGAVSGTTGTFTGAVSGTTGTFSSTVSGTTITASTQFSGPGTGLTGTASSLTVGASVNATNVVSGGTIASNVTATTQVAGTNNTTVATTAYVIANGVPSGAILLWSGSVGSIPSGWLLCNGASGTPDLRDRFVVGAGSTYAVGATGGSANAIVVAHTHTGTTSTIGNHQHYMFGGDVIQDGYLGNYPNNAPRIGASVGNGGMANENYEYNMQAAPTDASAGLTSAAGTHSHTFTTDSSGGPATNANLPPYYALCYIMKA